MKIFPVLAVVVLCLAAAQAGTRRPQLVRLHQVTRSEYNELLHLTQGQEMVSEARLLSSPIAGIKGLAAGVKGGFAVGNFFPAFFRSGPKEVISKKGHPLCVISPKNPYDEEEEENSRSISVAYEPNTESGSSSGGPSEGGNGGDHGGGHGGGHGDGSDSDNDDADTDTPIVNCIVIVSDGETIKQSHGGSGKPNGKPPPSHGRYPPYYQPPYGYPYPGYYPPYPYPPPPPPKHTPRSFDRSIEAPEDVSRVIDAYNGYYYQPRQFTPRYHKRSRASQEIFPAYQPASYPQQEYASNYPKVVRNYGLNHPAPVYVRTPQFDQDQE
ncbi:uncharacterized protein LOC117587280 [Drosophila guanche]|uniref:DUF4794 domain-containing protein n=1 Tax=Drosophila guanche TaxID=7266 RepID=A0A3B0JRQ9_DROGU|nr:uncharacterized protein LOC117587280 [Drosophila guanche]SPP73808.1 Hypothetical predicted protein [Drosophila guanche]